MDSVTITSASKEKKGRDKMRKLTYLLFMSLIVTGCQGALDQPQNEARNNNEVRVKQTVPEREAQKEQRVDNQTAQETAQRLVKLAVKVPGVHDATAVVVGRNAIVGIDVGAKLDRSRVGTIKYSVVEALREDPFGARAVVTADADTLQRLREIAADIGNGHPVTGFTDEFAEMFGRLVPQFPHPAQPENNNPEYELQQNNNNNR